MGSRLFSFPQYLKNNVFKAKSISMFLDEVDVIIKYICMKIVIIRLKGVIFELWNIFEMIYLSDCRVITGFCPLFKVNLVLCEALCLIKLV